MTNSKKNPQAILEDRLGTSHYYTIATRVVKKPCMNTIAHCEDPNHTTACDEHWKLLEERLCPCCVCLFDDGFMYESVQELELRSTARNEPRPKAEEERNGKNEGRREAAKEDDSKEASRLGKGTAANHLGSNSDEQANVLVANSRQGCSGEAEKEVGSSQE